MLSGGMLLLLTVLMGLLALISVIFSIVYFANANKNKFIWLAVFIISLAGMIVSIYFLAAKISNRAKHFAETLNNRYAEEVNVNSNANYNFADSIDSEQLHYLKSIEPAEFKNKIPEQFYNYLGFADYYRLPLKYPFSLHCEEGLANASLYNEQKVQLFNVNDNGEENCSLNNISEFAFDETIFIAKLLKKDAVTHNNLYCIYYFTGGKTEQFKSLHEVKLRAKELNFTVPIKLTSCAEYYELLK